MTDIFQRLYQENQKSTDAFSRLNEAIERNNQRYGAILDTTSVTDQAKKDEANFVENLSSNRAVPSSMDFTKAKDLGVSLVDGAVDLLDIGAGLADVATHGVKSIHQGYMNMGSLASPSIFGDIQDVPYSGYVAQATHDFRQGLHKPIQSLLSEDAQKSKQNFALGMDADTREIYDKAWTDAYKGGLNNVMKQTEGLSVDARNAQIEKYTTEFSTAWQKNMQKHEVDSSTSMDKPLTENLSLLGESTSHVLQDPLMGLNTVAQSIPSIILGGAIGRSAGAVGSKLGAVGLTADQIAMRGLTMTAEQRLRQALLAGAGGEGAVMGGSMHTQIADQSPTGLVDEAGRVASLVTGLGGAGVAVVGGKFAKRIGLEDVDSIATGLINREARQALNQSSKLNPLARLAGATAIEAGEEALQSSLETVSQNLAQGKDPLYNLNNNVALGAFAGGVMGAGMSTPQVLGTSAQMGVDALKSKLKQSVDTVKDSVTQTPFEELSNPQHENYNPIQAVLSQIPHLSSEDATAQKQAQDNITQIQQDLDTEIQDTTAKLNNISALMDDLDQNNPPDKDTKMQELQGMLDSYAKVYKNYSDQYLGINTELAKLDDHKASVDQTHVTDATLQDAVDTLVNSTQSSAPSALNSEEALTQITPEQQQAKDQVTKHMSDMSPEQLTTLSTSLLFDETQRSAIRQLADTKVALNSAKDSDQVHQEIINGSKGKTTEESNRGLNDYTQLIQRGIATNNPQLIQHAMSALGNWAQNHTNKVQALETALHEVPFGQKYQVIPVKQNQWSIIKDSTQFLSADELKKVGGWNVHQGSNKSGRIDRIRAEADLISQTFNSLDQLSHAFLNTQQAQNTQQSTPNPTTPPAPATAPTTPAPTTQPTQTAPSAVNIYAGTNENAHLSNFAERKFTANGQQFHSVEQAFHHAKAMFVGDTQLADKILKETNGAKIKNLTSARNLQMTQKQLSDWNATSEVVLKDLMRQSFKQNPQALQQLLDTGTSTLTHQFKGVEQDSGRFSKVLTELRQEFMQTQQNSQHDDSIFDGQDAEINYDDITHDFEHTGSEPDREAPPDDVYQDDINIDTENNANSEESSNITPQHGMKIVQVDDQVQHNVPMQAVNQYVLAHEMQELLQQTSSGNLQQGTVKYLQELLQYLMQAESYVWINFVENPNSVQFDQVKSKILNIAGNTTLDISNTPVIHLNLNNANLTSDMQETLVHEYVHALTSAWLSSRSETNSTYLKLQQIGQALKNYAEQHTELDTETVKRITQAQKNVKEVLAFSLTNPEIIAVLPNISIGTKTADVVIPHILYNILNAQFNLENNNVPTFERHTRSDAGLGRIHKTGGGDVQGGESISGTSKTTRNQDTKRNSTRTNTKQLAGIVPSTAQKLEDSEQKLNDLHEVGRTIPHGVQVQHPQGLSNDDSGAVSNPNSDPIVVGERGQNQEVGTESGSKADAGTSQSLRTDTSSTSQVTHASPSVKVLNALQERGELNISNAETIQKIQDNPNYVSELSADGTLRVIGALNTETGEWVGISPEQHALFKPEVEAQIPVLQNITSAQRTTERAKPYKQRNLIQAHFDQRTKDTVNPLVRVKDFISQITQRGIQAFQQFTTKPLTPEQIAELTQFHEFAEYYNAEIRKTFRANPTDVRYKDFTNFLVNEQGELDENVLTAISLAVYSYVIENGQKTSNTDKDIAKLLHLDSDVSNLFGVAEQFRTVGDSQAVVMYKVGSKISELLNLRVRNDSDPRMQSRLDGALGGLAVITMLNDGLFQETVISGESVAETLQALKQDTSKVGHSYSYIRVALNQNETAHIGYVTDMLKAHVDTQGILSKVFASQIGLRVPTFEMPMQYTQTRINKTTAVPSSQQRKNIEASQKNSFSIRKTTADVFKYLYTKNAKALNQLLGIHYTLADLDALHISQRKNTQAKLDAEQKLVAQAMQFLDMAGNEDGTFKEFWDTQHISANNRMYYDSNLFNVQGSQIHRALAGLTKFAVEIDLNLAEQGDVEHKTRLVNFFLSIAEGMEGVDKQIMEILHRTNQRYRFGTSDKVLAEDFLPAMMEILGQDYISQAIYSLNQIQHQQEQQSDIDAVQTLVDTWGMGVQSLQALIQLSELYEASQGSGKFISNAGLSSDGINNGVAIANAQLGVLSVEMSQQVGLIPMSADSSHQMTSMQEVYSNGISDYYVTFGAFIEKAWDDAVASIAHTGYTWLADADVLFKSFNKSNMRKIAKAWSVPFNYSAGFPRLNAVLADVFMQDIYTQLMQIQKLASTAKANNDDVGYQAQVKAKDAIQTHLNNIFKVFDSNLWAQGKIPLIKLPNPEYLHQWDFGIKRLGQDIKDFKAEKAKYVAVLVDVITHAHGDAGRVATEQYAQTYMQIRDLETQMQQATFEAYNTIYQRLVAQKLLELREAGAIDSDGFEGLSTDELNSINQQMKAYAPLLQTAMSIQSENSFESAIALAEKSRKLNEYTDAQGIEVRHNTTAKDAKAKTKGTKLGLQSQDSTNAGVKGFAAQVQSVDATVSSTTTAQTPAINIHDANISGVGDFTHMTQVQNQTFFESVLNHHLQLENVESLLRAIEGVQALAKEVGMSEQDLADLTKHLLNGDGAKFKGLNKALGKYLKYSGKHLKEYSVGTLQNFLTYVLTHAVRHEISKLNTLMNTHTVHQYGGVGGEFTLTDAHTKQITQQQEKVLEREQAFRVRIEALKQGLLQDKPADLTITVESKQPLNIFLESRIGTPIEIQDLLDVLNKTKMTAIERMLLNTVAKLLPPHLVLNYFNIDNVPDGVDVEGVNLAKVHAWYNEDDNTINMKSIDSVGARVDVATVIHELFHSALALRIKEVRNHPEKYPDMVQALDQLDALREEILAHHPKDRTLAHMLSDVDEFISYGLTETKLQEILQNTLVNRNGRTRTTMSSMWYSFVESIAKLLGFRSTQIPALLAFSHDVANVLQHAEPVPFAPSTGMLFSRSLKTQQDYENRIRDIFADRASPTATDTTLLDRSDVLDMLGYGEYGVRIHEKHAIGDGRINHPEITEQDWLDLPDWLDNPSAVYKQVDAQGNATGKVTFITPVERDGKVIIIGLDPKELDLSAENGNRQLVLTMYAGQKSYIEGQLQRGELLYANSNMLPQSLSAQIKAQQAKTSTHVSTREDLNNYLSLSLKVGADPNVQQKAKKVLEGDVGKVLGIGAENTPVVLTLRSVQRSLKEGVKNTQASQLNAQAYFTVLNAYSTLLSRAVKSYSSIVKATGAKINYYAIPIHSVAQNKVYVLWAKTTEVTVKDGVYAELEFVKVANLEPTKPSVYEDTTQPYVKKFQAQQKVYQEQTARKNKRFSSPPPSSTQHVNQQSTLELLQQLSAQGLTPEFNQHLDDLIDQTIGQLYRNDQTAKSQVDQVLQQNASDAVQAGFNMTDKEDYTQQAVEIVFNHFMENAKGSLVQQQLFKSFEQARATLKPLDFHQGDWTTASTLERQLAQSKYDYLFKSQQGIDFLSRFASMALSNQELRTLVDKIQMKESTAQQTWFERMISTYHYAVNWLLNRTANLSVSDNVRTRTDKLTQKLTQLDVRMRQNQIRWYDIAWNSIGYVTTPLNKVLGGGFGYLFNRPLFSNSSFTLVRKLGRIAQLSPVDSVTTLPKAVANMRDAYHANERLGDVMGLVSEVAEPSALRKIYDRLVRQTNHNAKQRKGLTDAVKKAILNAFTDQGAKLTKEQHKALTQGLLRTDLQALLADFTPADILDLISDKAVRAKHIAELEHKVSQLVQGNDYLNRAKQLAHYMVNQEGGLDLVKNVEGIVDGVGTPYFRTETVPADLNKNLDMLVSLYALNIVGAETHKTLKDLIQNEPFGVKSVIQLHQLSVRESKKDFVNTPYNYSKGYLPEITNPYRELYVANSQAERTQMEKEGWKYIGDLTQDTTDSRNPRILMVHYDRGYQRIVSGALDLISSKARGTLYVDRSNPHMMSVDKAQQLRAKLRAKTPTKNFNPRDVLGAIPTYDINGDVLSYHYEMGSVTRDTVLERNNNFADLLSALEGKNFYRNVNRTQSDEVLSVVAEDYKNNYAKNPQAFVFLSPHSRNPKDVELWRMLPQDFRKNAEQVFGKGKPIAIRNEVLNIAFGYRKYSVTEMFDKVALQRNGLEKIFVGFAQSFLGDKARGHIATAEHAIQEIVRLAKDIIVIRSISVLWGNIRANALLLLAQGINPVQIAKDIAFSLYNARKYTQLSNQLLALEAQVRMGDHSSKLSSEIARTQYMLAQNPLGHFIEKGMLSTIVEDVAIQQADYSYKSEWDKKVSQYTSWIPTPMKTVAQWLVVSPNTAPYQFLAVTTQLSDFIAKYSLYEHLRRQGVTEENALVQSSQTFINYDVPTTRSMQYANDMGFFMFTKFFIRAQAVLLRLMDKRTASVLGQQLLTHVATDMAGVLEPLAIARIGSNPFEGSALSIFSAVGELPVVNALN